jgi:hypothetical protein
VIDLVKWKKVHVMVQAAEYFFWYGFLVIFAANEVTRTSVVFGVTIGQSVEVGSGPFRGKRLLAK